MPAGWSDAEIAHRTARQCLAGYSVVLHATRQQARTARKVVARLRAVGIDVTFGESEDGLYVIASRDRTPVGELVGSIR